MAGSVVSGSPLAISTKWTYLKWGHSPGDVTQKLDIRSFSDLVGEPTMIPVTTLSHERIVQISGLLSGDAITFEVNYTKEHYAIAKMDAGMPLFFRLVFQDGSGFTWEGSYSLPVAGGSVDEAVSFSISVSVSSDADWFDDESML